MHWNKTKTHSKVVSDKGTQLFYEALDNIY